MTTEVLERPAAAPAITDIPDEWTVDVTEEDIQLGAPRSAWDCAIARATRRALVLRGWMPRDGDVCVDAYSLQVCQRYQEWGLEVIQPRRWRHDGGGFVIDFDVETPVQPRTVRFTAL